MPPLARLFIKTALAYFVLALLVGLLLAVTAWLNLPSRAPALNPVYFHLFMLGWVTQLIAGVAYWMFPKFSRERPRGSEHLAWSTYLLLNAGLLLRVVAEPAHTISASSVWGVLLGVSALLQWLGGAAFVANTWPRVKAK
jgi:hypothetical protein